MPNVGVEEGVEAARLGSSGESLLAAHGLRHPWTMSTLVLVQLAAQAQEVLGLVLQIGVDHRHQPAAGAAPPRSARPAAMPRLRVWNLPTTTPGERARAPRCAAGCSSWLPSSTRTSSPSNPPVVEDVQDATSQLVDVELLVEAGNDDRKFRGHRARNLARSAGNQGLAGAGAAFLLSSATTPRCATFSYWPDARAFGP